MIDLPSGHLPSNLESSPLYLVFPPFWVSKRQGSQQLYGRWLFRLCLTQHLFSAGSCLVVPCGYCVLWCCYCYKLLLVVTVCVIDFVSHLLTKNTGLQPLLFSPGLCLCGPGSPLGLDSTLRKPLGLSLKAGQWFSSSPVLIFGFSLYDNSVSEKVLLTF